MADKFEIDDKVSKEDILKELQTLDVLSQHDGTTESMGERVARVKAKNKPPLLMVIMSVAIGLVVLGILAVVVSKYAGNVKQVAGIKVPAVVGKSSAAAHQMIIDAGLRPVEKTIQSSSPKGTVVDTTPAANTELKEGSNVTINISSGSK